MKLTEIKQPSDAKLFESIDPENDTGVLTEDLVKIVRADQANQWEDPVDADEFIRLMEESYGGKTK